MRIITIEIDKEKYLFVVEELLDNLGLKYYLDDSEALEKSILTGYNQSKNGLARQHTQVMQEFIDKYK